MHPIRLSLFLFIIVSSLLAGCAAPIIPATPTPDLAATQAMASARTEAVQTMSAAMTDAAANASPTARIATMVFTETLSSTTTYTPAPSSTATQPAASATAAEIIAFTPTSTATRAPATRTNIPEPYQCSLIRTEPRTNTYLGRGEDFDARWVIQNTGSETWLESEVLYAFRNGMEMQLYGKSFNLPVKVKPLEKIELIVDMKTPLEPGAYTAYWVLRRKGEDFCWFSVDIRVRE